MISLKQLCVQKSSCLKSKSVNDEHKSFSMKPEDIEKASATYFEQRSSVFLLKIICYETTRGSE